VVAAGIAACDRAALPAAPSSPEVKPPAVIVGGAPLPAQPRRTIEADGPTQWFLEADGARATLSLDALGHSATGTLALEGGRSDRIDSLRVEEGRLSFCRNTPDGFEWFKVRIAEGVMVGRTAVSTSSAAPPLDPTAWAGHVTGWCEGTFSSTSAPFAFDLELDGQSFAMLRIDPSGRIGPPRGRLKVYALAGADPNGELEEEDLDVQLWDGRRLAFASHSSPVPRTYLLVIDGRTISGTYSEAFDASLHGVFGVRADVLGFGLLAKQPAALEEWQSATKKRLELLIMNAAPPPSQTIVSIVSSREPFPDPNVAGARDDDVGELAAGYGLFELQLIHQIEDSDSGGSITRNNHGWLAVPDSLPPDLGFPAVVALNGHDTSARHLMDPDDPVYWYGDAFARRGFVVLGIDIGHRPLSDRSSLYEDRATGDDPIDGNFPHPAVAAPGMSSNWEEDGERAYDVMRAVDVLRATPGVDPNRIFVAGLSLGGEVTVYAGALEERLSGVMVAGFSPDLAVLDHHNNHPCWRWQHANIREYIDISDLFALTAPRTLIVETGLVDSTFSGFAPPFAADKQVVRRARAAYRDTPADITHYLHDGGHLFLVGGQAMSGGVTVPVEVRPTESWSQAWQTDPTVRPLNKSVFDLVTPM
jgi:dienelactone hydrolase